MAEQIIHLPVMVSVDKRGVHDVLLPGIASRVWRGVSLAELLDDVALHLMEVIPSMAPAEMPRMRLCPDVELRRVKVTARIGGTPRKPVLWTGRLSVVVTRWKEDGFYTCVAPRLGLDAFAVERTGWLEEGLGRFVEQWAEGRELEPGDMEPFECRGYEYVEVLEVDTELPTVLPSRPAKRPKPKKKARGLRKTRAEKRGEKAKRRLVPPRTLRQVGVDLTHRAIDGRLGRTFGRDAIVADVMQRLERPGAAVLLVGPSGVGKTAIVYEVARRLAARGEALHARTDVWAVDGNRIIAGMSVVGAWEQRCKEMVAELDARQDVLFVEDMPALVHTGRTSHSETNVATFLEPHLARGELRIIGECTAERLEATREEAPGFFSRFAVVQVPELAERETLMVLVDAVRAIEAREAVRVEPEVLEGILALTRRFQRRQCHPGKAVSWLERLVSDHHAVERDDYGRRVLDRERLVDFFARRTGLPRFVLWEQQSRPFDEVAAHFERRIIGQPAASRAAAEIVCVLQQGLDDPERPLATMLFVGPTGVGKTETAKALAEYLFGSGDRLIRFDMSEFRDPWSMARLFGDRWQPEGELTRKVAQQPFSVVLFDEIEKAHPRVFDAFLQVFGEGRLTNAAGRTTDFCNTILVMTSNLGVREAERAVGFAELRGSGEARHFTQAAEAFFRPEFFNRIDRIVAFRSLGRADLGPLIKRILAAVLARRGLRRSGVMVEVEPELVELLVDEGFDPRYGARSLRRALEQRLTVPLARRLVSQPVDRTTLVQLYRFGDEIGMDVWSLDDAIEAPAAADVIDDWAAVRARVAAARADLARVLDAETLSRRAAERTALLGAFNAGAMPDGGWARLTVLNGLLDPLAGSRTGGPAGVSDVRLALDAIEERFLAEYEFVEEVGIVGAAAEQLQRNWDPASWRARAVGTEKPMRRQREGLFTAAVAAVERAERDLAGVAFRMRALDAAAPEGVLVRVLPGTEEPGSWGWSRAVANGLLVALRRWGDVTWWERSAAGWGEPPRDRERHGTRADEAPAEGWALWVRGFGVATLAAGEAGFHLSMAYSGADLVCSLARVDVIDGIAGPEAWLAGDDSAHAAWRAARRRGEAAASPRPTVLIRRRFVEGVALDAETGVEVRTADLGSGIARVLDRRLLARHREA
ncbi:MAG: AAA family ATPase [bacterium]